MNKSRVFGLICLALLLFSLCACSDSKFPYGTYVSKDSFYKYIFNTDGSFVFSAFGSDVATGTFSINGDELTFETSDYCENKGFGKATYTWTFKDDTLQFEVKGEDSCGERREATNYIPFLPEK